MKHLSLIMALVLALFLPTPAASAAPLQKDMKVVEKMAGARARELTAQGWSPMSDTPIEESLRTHLAATEYEGMTEQPGVSTKTKNRNNGRMLARSNAMTRYADSQVSRLKGQLSRALGAEADSDDLQHFYGAFERHLEGEIRSVMTESLAMIRENAEGVCEVQILYLLHPEKEAAALANATRNAVKETQLPDKYASRISAIFEK